MRCSSFVFLVYCSEFCIYSALGKGSLFYLNSQQIFIFVGRYRLELGREALKSNLQELVITTSNNCLMICSFTKKPWHVIIGKA